MIGVTMSLPFPRLLYVMMTFIMYFHSHIPFVHTVYI